MNAAVQRGSLSARLWRILQAAAHTDNSAEKSERFIDRLRDFDPDILKSLVSKLRDLELEFSVSQKGDAKEAARYLKLVRAAQTEPRPSRRAPTPPDNAAESEDEGSDPDWNFYEEEPEQASSERPEEQDEPMDEGPEPSSPPPNRPNWKGGPERSRPGSSGGGGRGPRRCAGCKTMGCSPLKRACPTHYSKVAGLQRRAEDREDRLRSRLTALEGKLRTWKRFGRSMRADLDDLLQQ